MYADTDRDTGAYADTDRCSHVHTHTHTQADPSACSLIVGVMFIIDSYSGC